MNPTFTLRPSFALDEGEGIMFDARGSYSTNGQITQYEWDTNNDGIYEQTTTTGTLTRVFNSPLDTTARVRVTDETGHTSIATAPVLVTIEPDPQPEPDTTTLQDKPGVSEVLDEQATALFPELTPIAKDASLPETTRTEPNNSTPTHTHTPTTTHLSQHRNTRRRSCWSWHSADCYRVCCGCGSA